MQLLNYLLITLMTFVFNYAIILFIFKKVDKEFEERNKESLKKINRMVISLFIVLLAAIMISSLLKKEITISIIALIGLIASLVFYKKERKKSTI